MKKLIVLISILAIAASMSACGKKDDKSALVGEGTESGTVIGGADEATDIKVTDETQEDKKSDYKTSDDKKAEQKSESKAEQKSENNTASDDTAEEKKVTPTFMFFVTKQDADYDKAMKAVEELKKAYGDKINFDITDIDEEPEAKENFALVVGNTPALIMLNTSNDISDLKMKISDKAEMEASIKNALQ